MSSIQFGALRVTQQPGTQKPGWARDLATGLNQVAPALAAQVKTPVTIGNDSVQQSREDIYVHVGTEKGSKVEKALTGLLRALEYNVTAQ